MSRPVPSPSMNGTIGWSGTCSFPFDKRDLRAIRRHEGPCDQPCRSSPGAREAARSSGRGAAPVRSRPGVPGVRGAPPVTYRVQAPWAELPWQDDRSGPAAGGPAIPAPIAAARYWASPGSEPGLGPPGRAALLGAARFRGRLARKAGREGRPCTGCARHLDGAAVRLDDLPGHVETQPEAAEVLGRAPPAGSARRPAPGARGAMPMPWSVTSSTTALPVGSHAQHDRPPLPELGGVDEQVGDDLLHPEPVERRRGPAPGRRRAASRCAAPRPRRGWPPPGPPRPGRAPRSAARAARAACARRRAGRSRGACSRRVWRSSESSFSSRFRGSAAATRSSRALEELELELEGGDGGAQLVRGDGEELVPLAHLLLGLLHSRARSSIRRRSATSRTAAMVQGRPSISMGARLISAGNSLPSRRRPERSRPRPMGRRRGAAW